MMYVIGLIKTSRHCLGVWSGVVLYYTINFGTCFCLTSTSVAGSSDVRWECNYEGSAK